MKIFKKHRLNRLKDLTGKTVGKLTVLHLNKERSEECGRGIWICKCFCGNIINIPASKLTAKRDRPRLSCGCIAKGNLFINLTGKKFGKLTVVSQNKDKRTCSSNNSRIYWNVKCDCGNFDVKLGRDLKCGRVRSCGCLFKECLKTINRKSPGESAGNQLFYKYKLSASQRELEFNLSKDSFLEIIGKNCHYCDIYPSEYYGSSPTCILANGIDRLNNNIGYTIDNTVSCCTSCNFMKHTNSEEDFIEKIIKIYKHRCI